MNRNQSVEIDVLAASAFSRSCANGFWQHFPDLWIHDERPWIGEKIALAHTELSEVIDASRKVVNPGERFEKILAELGDTIWRCLDMAYVIMQYDELSPDVTLGIIMQTQANNMLARGKLHGKRW